MFGQPNNFNNNGNGFGGGFGGQQYGGGFQQPQQAQPQPTQMTAAQMLDSIDSQSSKSFKFQNPGDSVSGVIESVTASQMHVYDSLNQRPTNQPDFFQDGSPKLQVIVTIDTGLTDPSVEDDDGRRSIYIKGYGIQRRAWLQAIRNAGLRKASEIKPGDRFTAKFVGYDPQSKNPNNPAKMYEYAATPAAAGAAGCPRADGAAHHAAGVADPAAQGPGQDPAGGRADDGPDRAAGAAGRRHAAVARQRGGARLLI